MQDVVALPGFNQSTPTGASPPRGDARRRAAVVQANWIPAVALLSLLVGGAVHLGAGGPLLARQIWLGTLVVTGGPLVWRTVRGLLAGRFAADVVASLAIATAVVLQEPLAGLVIVLMQSGGEALERHAAGRASEAVRDLEASAPRHAHVRSADGTLRDVSADAVRVGDMLLVRPGEMVPCDAVVTSGRSGVDTSRLTGEPLPLAAAPGVTLLSGSVNGSGPLIIRATALAGESQYARIVDLVRAAQASKSPLQRVADRYAVWFTPVTVLACAIAYLASGDASRILAVLVVATPCPLILATPVAIIGGINRAARRQIIFRHGGALEQLAGITTAVFDKTGTLTIGRPRVSAVRSSGRLASAEILRLAGAIEQASSHLLARTVVDAAHEAGLRLPDAAHVVESPGRGVTGEVDGRTVTVGAKSLVLEHAPGGGASADIDRVEAGGEQLRAYVAVDGQFVGTIEYADELRPGLTPFLADLRSMGVHRTLLLSGDREANTRAVARAVGITEVRGDLLPADKVDVVNALTASGEIVLMVGDGTNDAPALSASAVGIALAGHGGGITAEAADVVLLVDDLARVAEAMRISRRTLRVARQSIVAGLTLSAIAMVAAAFGLIVPAVGALLQEAIDVAVILNALRARRA